MKPIPFDNRYVDLGDAFYEKNVPTPVARPQMIIFNEALAQSLGLVTEGLSQDDMAAIFSGNAVPEGASPLAMAYAGHQFGHFVPQLGDGRALLLGEVVANDGTRIDIHLKGTGQTHFSRNGDGRAALGPVLREYLVSEAMHQLGVPTTRALAAVKTGEQVVREQMLPGGIVTRTAKSFVRVGTFQYFYARGDQSAVKTLADHVIARNYPELAEADNPYAALLQAVVDGQANLIAQWMGIGFIHGVMNTDNMSVACETIDYGPCAFMDYYAQHQVYSYIDRNGRYAYGNQPYIGLWDLTRLAECLLSLLADDSDAAIEAAQSILQSFNHTYEQAWLDGMRRKCGLTANTGATDEADKALIESLLSIMEANHADFTLMFYYLSQLGDNDEDSAEALQSLRGLFTNPDSFGEWLAQWRQRVTTEQADASTRQAAMQAVNPLYIPRNHQIEAAIRAAEDHDDFSVFHALHQVLQQPYTVQPGKESYTLPPKPEEVVQNTFCGT